jgi:hypothetical protein
MLSRRDFSNGGREAMTERAVCSCSTTMESGKLSKGKSQKKEQYTTEVLFI